MVGSVSTYLVSVVSLNRVLPQQRDNETPAVLMWGPAGNEVVSMVNRLWNRYYAYFRDEQ
jgi:hypothetical protein